MLKGEPVGEGAPSIPEAEGEAEEAEGEAEAREGEAEEAPAASEGGAEGGSGRGSTCSPNPSAAQEHAQEHAQERGGQKCALELTMKVQPAVSVPTPPSIPAGGHTEASSRQVHPPLPRSSPKPRCSSSAGMGLGPGGASAPAAGGAAATLSGSEENLQPPRRRRASSKVLSARAVVVRDVTEWLAEPSRRAGAMPDGLLGSRTTRAVRVPRSIRGGGRPSKVSGGFVGGGFIPGGARAMLHA